MKKAGIDNKLQDVLNYLKSFIDENGFPPSVREIASTLHIKSTATVYYYLEKLEAMGCVKKSKSKNRALEVVGYKAKADKDMTSVPVVGQIAAGEPIWAVENYEDTFSLPTNLFGYDDLFMLNVKGNSMIEAGIFDGDMIVVKRQETANNGDIVVALLDDSSTVKRFFRKEDYVILHPENSTMSDIMIKDVQILGRVIGSIRKFR